MAPSVVWDTPRQRIADARAAGLDTVAIPPDQAYTMIGAYRPAMDRYKAIQDVSDDVPGVREMKRDTHNLLQFCNQAGPVYCQAEDYIPARRPSDISINIAGDDDIPKRHFAAGACNMFTEVRGTVTLEPLSTGGGRAIP